MEHMRPCVLASQFFYKPKTILKLKVFFLQLKVTPVRLEIECRGKNGSINSTNPKEYRK